jgi:hypothetical protein
MMRASVQQASRATSRPLVLAALAVAGVVLGVALAVASLVYAGAQALAGTSSVLSMAAGVIGLLVALILVWFYWGLWEMIGSAWWSHIILGPLGVIGLLLLLPALPDAVTMLLGPLTEEARSGAVRLASGAVLVTVVLECAVIGYLPVVRHVFGIGRRKQAWER